jgi:hypothetical protein
MVLMAETARPDEGSGIDPGHKYGFMVFVKTTFEIPDPLYRKLKACAALRGKSVRTLVNEAIAEKLREPAGPAGGPIWRQAFGGLKHLHRETKRIETVIDEEFGRIEPEDWR